MQVGDLRQRKRDLLYAFTVMANLLQCHTILEGIDCHIFLAVLGCIVDQGDDRRVEFVFDCKHEPQTGGAVWPLQAQPFADHGFASCIRGDTARI